MSDDVKISFKGRYGNQNDIEIDLDVFKLIVLAAKNDMMKNDAWFSQDWQDAENWVEFLDSAI